MDKNWHRDVIKQLQKKGLTSGDILEAPSLSTSQKWASAFKRDGESPEDGPRSGRPLPLEVEENTIRELMLLESPVRKLEHCEYRLWNVNGFYWVGVVSSDLAMSVKRDLGAF